MTSAEGQSPRGRYRKLTPEERVAFKITAQAVGLAAACAQFQISERKGRRLVDTKDLPSIVVMPPSMTAAHPVTQAVHAVLVPPKFPPPPPLPPAVDGRVTHAVAPVVPVTHERLNARINAEMFDLVPALRSDDGARRAFRELVRAQAVTAEIVLTLHELGIRLETASEAETPTETVLGQGEEIVG